MFDKKNPFNLTQKEQIIEVLGTVLFAFVMIGSFLKLLFF
jgi:hypothetical protein